MVSAIGSELLLKPIDVLLNDVAVSEIILNQPGVVFYEIKNQFYRFSVPIFTSHYLKQLFQLIANENQQVLSSDRPLLSGVLKGGSRIQLVIPPVSDSCSFSIRKKRDDFFSFDELNAAGYFSKLNEEAEAYSYTSDSLLTYYKNQQWLSFIKAALVLKKNIVISGATSSGKTTFLNACLKALPLSERLIILEDTAELSVSHENYLRLLAFKGNQSTSAVTMQDLLQCSLRLRPDRIIVGEVRGKELLDFISASLTGHGGAITSIHADSPETAFTRMCQMYKLNVLPAMTDQDIYREIKQAVDIVIQLKRTTDRRHIESVYYRDAKLKS